MTPQTRVQNFLRLAEKATPGPWRLDHDDTYVAAEKSPPEHDWYWITGGMESRDDGYTAASSDEDMRGPKPVVQANCRFISAARSESVWLATSLLKCMEALEFYANTESCGPYYYNSEPAMGHIANKARAILQELGAGE